MDSASHVSLRRIQSNVIVYDVTTNALGGAEPETTRTYHCNRTATFFGPHTGNGGERQMGGGAGTLWREDDTQLLMAFRRAFPFASVSFS